MPDEPTIDTSNHYSVRPHHGLVRIGHSAMTIAKRDAVNLAAWLVAVADPGRKQFDRVLNEVLHG